MAGGKLVHYVEDQDVIHLGAKGIVVVGPHEGPAGFFIAAMAMISLLCAVYEAMNQRIWSSGALATIFVVAFLLFYFPQLAHLIQPVWNLS